MHLTVVGAQARKEQIRQRVKQARRFEAPCGCAPVQCSELWSRTSLSFAPLVPALSGPVHTAGVESQRSVNACTQDDAIAPRHRRLSDARDVLPTISWTSPVSWMDLEYSSTVYIAGRGDEYSTQSQLPYHEICPSIIPIKVQQHRVTMVRAIYRPSGICVWEAALHLPAQTRLRTMCKRKTP